MKRPVVLLDTDGVKADFLKHALQVVNRITGKHFTPDSFPSWDIFDTIGKEHEAACYEEFNKEGFCAGFDVYPGAIEGVQLVQEIADVYVVTSPTHSSPFWMWERTQWLKKHFGISHKNVIHCSAKRLVRGDVLVDDKPDHIADWIEVNPEGMGLLWDQPYNRTLPPGVNVRLSKRTHAWGRVRSWQDVVQVAKSYRHP